MVRSATATSHVATGKPRTEVAHDLPVDGPQQLGPVIGGDRLVTLRSDEHDLVSLLDLVVAHVDDHHVHRHGSRVGVALAAYEDFGRTGETAGHTVGVADGDSGARQPAAASRR